mmetsp:Transcript_78117/g.243283  ORF Transcript_78117/g.243283 Transcript_78117/m.243283 type:complete len:297 (+) Transcript_78117:246-1136(+)
MAGGRAPHGAPNPGRLGGDRGGGGRGAGPRRARGSRRGRDHPRVPRVRIRQGAGRRGGSTREALPAHGHPCRHGRRRPRAGLFPARGGQQGPGGRDGPLPRDGGHPAESGPQGHRPRPDRREDHAHAQGGRCLDRPRLHPAKKAAVGRRHRWDYRLGVGGPRRPAERHRRGHTPQRRLDLPEALPQGQGRLRAGVWWPARGLRQPGGLLPWVSVGGEGGHAARRCERHLRAAPPSALICEAERRCRRALCGRFAGVAAGPGPALHASLGPCRRRRGSHAAARCLAEPPRRGSNWTG